MASEHWTHSYCLACDKQVMTDGAAYCTESCRLADNEKTSTTSSQASSPGFAPTAYPWSTGSSTQFYLSPALDFTNSQRFPARHQPSRASYCMGSTLTTSTTSNNGRFLTPSSSHSSLSSMGSTSTNGDASQLSEKTRRELQAYAVSFEQVRTQRRRSY